VLALYWKRVTKAGAIAGMIAGSGTVIIWKNVPMLVGFLYELVPGFVVSTLVIIIVSLLTRPPAQAVDPRTVDSG
jgi:sodium/proline symporter